MKPTKEILFNPYWVQWDQDFDVFEVCDAKNKVVLTFADEMEAIERCQELNESEGAK